MSVRRHPDKPFWLRCLIIFCLLTNLVAAFASRCDAQSMADDNLATPRTEKATEKESESAKPALDARIPVSVEGTTDADLVAQVRYRIDRDLELRNRQRALDQKPPVPAFAANQPRLMVDLAHYGNHYNQFCFVLLHLLVENPRNEALKIPRQAISAKIGGEVFAVNDVPVPLRNATFSYGSQHYEVPEQEQNRDIIVPAQGVAGGWLIFPGLALNSEVPSIQLSIRIHGNVTEIDVTESQSAALDLAIETLGPRDCLKLITIRGVLNSVNVQFLVSQLEKFTERKTTRFVVEWQDETPAPEQQLSYWLVNSALLPGAEQQSDDQYPIFPVLVREFHIVQPAQPGFPTSEEFGYTNLSERLHATAAAAVASALKSAFQALPRTELLQEIQSGHPLSRAAALRHGASQLSVDSLPLMFRLTNDTDHVIQTAAVQALSQFSDPAAVEMLVKIVRRNVAPASRVALEGLASSRFAIAHSQLLELLKQDQPDLKSQILDVLARHPRPEWSETIFAFVTDPQQPLTVEGIRALVQVGHPKTLEVMEAGLKSTDKEVRDFVFPILAQRVDARSERIATEYVLAQLAQGPPDGTITQFLFRTKLAAAVPLLLKHFDTASDKGTLINILTQIGDETTGNELAERYEKLQSHEKAHALNALRVLRHPQFREFAGAALLSQDNSLLSQATQTLLQEGSSEGCRLLIESLEKQTSHNALHNICNALGNFGSHVARDALIQARSSDNAPRKNAAINGLNVYYQHSPGYQYIWQAQNVMQQNNREGWQEALEYFDMSLQIDPELPEALAGLGCMQLRLGNMAVAKKHLEQAYRLDPYNHLAIPCLAEMQMTAGKLDEGLKLLEDGRERHEHDGIFLQSSGRAYALAVAKIDQMKDFPDRESRRSKYLKQSLDDLRQAGLRGFNNLAWLRDDPELQVLQNDPEFHKLLTDPPPVMDEQIPVDDSEEGDSED